VELIESSHSIWQFDTDRRRFRRLPPGADLDAPALEADWEEYFSLQIDDDNGSFTVTLNEDGTRLLRAFRKTDGDPPTEEFRLEGISETDT
jgi:hypothetical protein